jgi:hypothetical protein
MAEKKQAPTKFYSNLSVKTCVAAACIIGYAFCLISCGSNTERPNDYNLFEDLRDYSLQIFQNEGMTPRDDVPAIFNDEYVLDLEWLMQMVFGGPQLERHLESSGISLVGSTVFTGPIKRCPKCNEKVHVPVNKVCPNCAACFTHW